MRVPYYESLCNEIEEARIIKKNIYDEIDKHNIDFAKTKLHEYKQKYAYDIDIYVMESKIYSAAGNLEKAKKILSEGMKVRKNNFNINYELLKVYKKENNIIEMLTYCKELIAMLHVTKNEDEIVQVIQEAEEIINTLNLSVLTQEEITSIKEYIEIVKKYLDGEMIEGNRYFPKWNHNAKEELYVGQMIREKNNEGYLVGLCDGTITPPRIGRTHDIKTETIYSKLLKANEIFKVHNEKFVLPVLVKHEQTNITIKEEDHVYSIDKFLPNKFYYLKTSDKCQAFQISADKDIYIGNRWKATDDNPLKMVMVLFIDGLAQYVLKNNQLQEMMPHTYKFFEDGQMFSNAYINEQWTVTSVPTFFLGQYATTSNIFSLETNFRWNLFDTDKNLAQLFQDNNYLTFNAGGNWASNPAMGFCSGFDRTVFKCSTFGAYNVDSVVFDLIEQLESFPYRSQFCYGSIFDLHHIIDNQILPTTVGTRGNILLHTAEKPIEKSLRLPFDSIRSQKYRALVKYVDLKLKMLYDYINNRYEQDEILVCLVSDHGQSYLDKKDVTQRIHIPFMIKGRGVKRGKPKELIGNTEVFSSLINLANINDSQSNRRDGKLPKSLGGNYKRDYIIQDAIFYGGPYNGKIIDEKHIFIFSTSNNVEIDGTVDITNSGFSLINIDNKENELEKYPDKVNKYTKIILEHIKDFIKV